MTLTKTDGHSQEDSCPEGHGTEEDERFVDKVLAREERVHDDPYPHHHRRPDDNDPGNGRPARVKPLAPDAHTELNRGDDSLASIQSNVGICREDGRNGDRSTEIRQSVYCPSGP